MTMVKEIYKQEWVKGSAEVHISWGNQLGT